MWSLKRKVLVELLKKLQFHTLFKHLLSVKFTSVSVVSANFIILWGIFSFFLGFIIFLKILLLLHFRFKNGVISRFSDWRKIIIVVNIFEWKFETIRRDVYHWTKLSEVLFDFHNTNIRNFSNIPNLDLLIEIIFVLILYNYLHHYQYLL